MKKLIIEECVKVSEKDGIKFELDFLSILNKEFNSSRNISSMQQDMIKVRKTEIDYLNVAVADLGKKYGIKCPVNEALAGIIKDIESQTKI